MISTTKALALQIVRPSGQWPYKLALISFGVVASMGLGRQAFALSTLDIVNAISPDGGVGVNKDLAYGVSPFQDLDIYYPKALTKSIRQGYSPKRRYPLVLFVHGGSWQSGDKDQYAFVGQSFAQAGFVTAVINYRKAPKHVYPTFVEDTAQAVAWMYKNADKFYAKPSQMAVVGHSAGAFNAVAAISNHHFLAKYGLIPSDIKAVIGIAGPYSYDFRKYPTQSAFPNNSDPANIMPDRLILGPQPNYLLLTAQHDEIVHDTNTTNMVTALESAGATVQTEVIKNANHATIIGAMATPLRWLNKVRDQVLGYLKQAL